MRYIIVDLEATCWENVRDAARMETIEIGAVEMPSATSEPSREFNRFVRPIDEPVLSPFCRRLTTIRQGDVDAADTFPTVFREFLEWIGKGPFVLGSWGQYDLSQLGIDCDRHRIPMPAALANHINIKKSYARLNHIKPCGMDRALAHAGLPLVGTHHRGLDDARNIARLAALVLPLLESGGGLV